MCGLLVVSKESGKLESVSAALETIGHRGPDATNIQTVGPYVLGFKRLAIMDLSHDGDQPFSTQRSAVVCNGEIYNYRELKSEYLSDYPFTSSSDCELIGPLYDHLGLEPLCGLLDGEYAFCLIDHETEDIIAARDPMGIRPLFFGYDSSGKICFASEVKALMPFCEKVEPFPPGHYYENDRFQVFHDYSKVKTIAGRTEEDVLTGIRVHLEKAVEKRLQSDAPVGFLLSGGLDSSLVCSIASRFTGKRIKTFAVGIDENPIDTKYARVVADHIESEHHEVLFSREGVLGALSDVIYSLESWDITTIRASIGMYLICKYIREHTDVKVLLTGEVSDEIFGYKYTDFAPSANAFQKEAQKRVRELYQYDVLRADRCISAHSLEARVPFSDQGFVNFVMSIDPKMKMNTTGIGKYLLRKAFDGGEYLPHDILYREKAAFSDAVGHSMVDWLKEYAELKYSEAEFQVKRREFKHGTPFTKESLLYREIFEQHFSGHSKVIKDFWMPNKEWQNCKVLDPSARFLPNYGLSGC
jgi:asparagine synthase (glutamine-hydrolysing)